MGPQQIIIVDNDPTAALVTQRGLQTLLGPTAEVTIAESPGHAWLHRLREAISLVIVDPNPQSRGAWALIKALRHEKPQTAVLVLTSYDTPKMRRESHALGVNQYLAKPVDLASLAHTVQATVAMTEEQPQTLIRAKYAELSLPSM